MYLKNPTAYFAALVRLARVLKIEIGKRHDFNWPATKEEALDRLERTTEPHARQTLDQFLN